MRCLMTPLTFVVSLTLAASSESAAQLPRAGTRPPPPPEPSMWGGAGLGASNLGLLLHIDLSQFRDARLLHGRLAGYTTLSDASTTELEAKNVVELSGMMGSGTLCCGGNWGSVAGGIGLLAGKIGDSDFT